MRRGSTTVGRGVYFLSNSGQGGADKGMQAMVRLQIFFVLLHIRDTTLIIVYKMTLDWQVQLHNNITALCMIMNA